MLLFLSPAGATAPARNGRPRTGGLARHPPQFPQICQSRYRSRPIESASDNSDAGIFSGTWCPTTFGRRRHMTSTSTSHPDGANATGHVGNPGPHGPHTAGSQPSGPHIARAYVANATIAATGAAPATKGSAEVASPGVKPRSVWTDAEVPVVLRLPDLSPPLPIGPPKKRRELPLTVFVGVAGVATLLGLVGIDRWNAYRSGKADKARFLENLAPPWKPLASPTQGAPQAEPEHHARQTGSTTPVDDTSSRHEATVAVHNEPAASTSAEPRQSAPTSPATSTASEAPPTARKLNPHFGPSAPEDNIPPSSIPSTKDATRAHRRQRRSARRRSIARNDRQTRHGANA